MNRAVDGGHRREKEVMAELIPVSCVYALQLASPIGKAGWPCE